MALADLMMVMEDGRIRQSGTAGSVRAPLVRIHLPLHRGDNVLPWHNGTMAQWHNGTIAVRADHCTLESEHDGPHLIGQVSVVEYQGPVVRVALATDSCVEAAALLPHRVYYRHPVAPGDLAKRCRLTDATLDFRIQAAAKQKHDDRVTQGSTGRFDPKCPPA